MRVILVTLWVFTFKVDHLDDIVQVNADVITFDSDDTHATFGVWVKLANWLW